MSGACTGGAPARSLAWQPRCRCCCRAPLRHARAAPTPELARRRRLPGPRQPQRRAAARRLARPLERAAARQRCAQMLGGRQRPTRRARHWARPLARSAALRRRPPEARRHRRYSRRRRGRRCSAVSSREGCGHGAAAGQRREAWPGAGQVGGRLDAPQGRRSAAQTRHAAPAGAGLISTARPVDPASAHRVRPYPNPLAPRNKLQRRAHFSRSSAEKAQSASWASRRASSASDSAAGPGAPFMSRWPPPPAMRTCASRQRSVSFAIYLMTEDNVSFDSSVDALGC